MISCIHYKLLVIPTRVHDDDAGWEMLQATSAVNVSYKTAVRLFTRCTLQHQYQSRMRDMEFLTITCTQQHLVPSATEPFLLWAVELHKDFVVVLDYNNIKHNWIEQSKPTSVTSEKNRILCVHGIDIVMLGSWSCLDSVFMILDFDCFYFT